MSMWELVEGGEEARIRNLETGRLQREKEAADRIVTCVYCGFEYPPGTATAFAEVLTEHIKTCKEHPMRGAEQDKETLKKRIEEMESSWDFFKSMATKAELYESALKRLACLGNGDKPGNSVGNIIAQEALKGE